MGTRRRRKTNDFRVFQLATKQGFVEHLIEHPMTQKYSNRINDKIRSDYGVIEEIIKHGPSIGNYYERILASNLGEYLPSRWKIGTGFVFDDVELRTSPQIDIIVYDDNTLAPIFRVGDLVVVRPEQVIGIIEVKKKLTLRDVDDLVDKYVFSNAGAEFGVNKGIQVLNIFSYERATSLKKYYERTIAALERNLAQIKNPDNPGMLKAVRTITVPRLYFLDTDQFIDTILNKDNLRHSIRVSLEGILYSSGGASDLFSRFVWSSGLEPLHKVLFSTIGLYKPIADHRIDTPVVLREFISAAEMLSRFSESDIARLKKQKLKEIAGFMQPYGTNIATTNELLTALKAGIIGTVRARTTKE